MLSQPRAVVATLGRRLRGERRATPVRRPDDAATRNTTLAIAVGSGLASFSMNFWWPFLPLYLQQIGKISEASALAWLAVATFSQGIARLVTGPLWGILSDRFGRKPMFVRALYAATLTTFIASGATEPWHIVVALTAQGLLSGFIPAGVALTSVSVSDERLSSSLGTVTAAQYLGNTVGPAAGALLAVGLGFRGAIIAAAILPAIAATFVLFIVPKDATGSREEAAGVRTPRQPFVRMVTRQFVIAVSLFFAFFALNQLVRTAAPIAIEDIVGHAGTKAAVGIAFTAAGLASVAGALIVARFFVHSGPRLRWVLAGLCVSAALGHLLLAGAGNIALFTLWFAFIGLCYASMVPATNLLIASSVPPEHRGTAFGIASSAQAVAFMVGPLIAAVMAATSMEWGFAFVGAALAVVAVGIVTLLPAPLTGRAPISAI